MAARAYARGVVAEGWSYAVLAIINPELKDLQAKLDRYGVDGWELVTSVSTNKTVIAFANQLVFVFKKPGLGHTPPELEPEYVPY